jgi:multidrug efflux system outer membrane protein
MSAALMIWSGVAGSGADAQQSGEADSTLTLIDAVALAFETHPAIGAAAAELEYAYTELGRAKAEWLPQLNARASLTQHQEPMIAYPLHELDLQTRPIFDRTLIQGGVDLGWMAFDGGGRRARIKGTRARAERAAVGQDGAAMQILAQVAHAYLAVLASAEVLAALDEHIAALSAERVRVVQLLEQGQAAEVERLRVDAAVAQADADRIATVAGLDASERSLARMLGTDPAATRSRRLMPVRLAAGAVEERTVLLDRLDTGNTQILQARRAAESAQWAKRATSATWWPRLDGFGSYGLWTIPDGEVVLEWQVGVRVSYPLFTGGARSRSVAGAAAKVDAAQEQLALAELEGREQLDRALTQVREQSARSEAVATAVRHLAEVTRIERLALDAGVGTQTDFLRAEADLHRARAALVQAEYGAILALVELARTTGDLTIDWLHRTLETSP